MVLVIYMICLWRRFFFLFSSGYDLYFVSFLEVCVIINGYD